jgi:hypothetical protein
LHGTTLYTSDAVPRAARPPERCGKAHHAQVVAAIPAGLTAEQWNSVPNAKDLCDTIRKIDGAKLAADIRKSLSSADLAALQGLIGTYRNVDETAVRTALDEWNAANLRVMSQFAPGRLIAPIQLHHACKGSPVIGRMGTFPTGDGMNGAVDRKSLTADNNPTVLVTRMLDASPDAVWGNLLPTTLNGDYTLVPSGAVFEAFAPAADDAVGALVAAGLQVFHCISPKNGTRAAWRRSYSAHRGVASVERHNPRAARAADRQGCARRTAVRARVARPLAFHERRHPAVVAERPLGRPRRSGIAAGPTAAAHREAARRSLRRAVCAVVQGRRVLRGVEEGQASCVHRGVRRR